MVSLILCLLLADAPPQATLPVTPPQSTLAAAPPQSALAARELLPPPAPPSVYDQAALAAELERPLVIWVGGYTDAALRKRLGDCVHADVTAWKGDATPGVLPCPLHEGWPHAFRRLPAGAVTEAAVRAELDAVIRQVRQPDVPAGRAGVITQFPFRMSGGGSPVPARSLFSAPRGANC